MLYVSSSLTLTTKKNKKMISISSGLTTLHVICQKMLGLWPIINSMSLLNLEAEANREPSAGGHQGPLIPAKHRVGWPFHTGYMAATLKCWVRPCSRHSSSHPSRQRLASPGKPLGTVAASLEASGNHPSEQTTAWCSNV